MMDEEEDLSLFDSQDLSASFRSVYDKVFKRRPPSSAQEQVTRYIPSISIIEHTRRLISLKKMGGLKTFESPFDLSQFSLGREVRAENSIMKQGLDDTVLRVSVRRRGQPNEIDNSDPPIDLK